MFTSLSIIQIDDINNFKKVAVYHLITHKI